MTPSESTLPPAITDALHLQKVYQKNLPTDKAGLQSGLRVTVPAPAGHEGSVTILREPSATGWSRRRNNP